MAAKRISMRYIKEILRLKFQANLSQRQISKSLSVSLGSVSDYLKRATEAGLTWPLPDGLGEDELEQLLFPNQSKKPATFAIPDCETIHVELKRKGATLQLLWQEYKQIHGEEGYQYTQFCHHYKQWKRKLKLSMRQVHRGGEKCFIDYCGPTVPVIDASTGEIRQAQVFVAVMGASSYTYAEATWTQKLFDWVTSHVNAFQYFGGVPEILAPDNLKSAVGKPCRYEPKINERDQHMAQYFDTAIIPARPYKPKDKAKAESGVLLVERWILACLRHETFFNLSDLNQRIKELLDHLNNKPFQKLEGSRRSHFEQLDKPSLRKLPSEKYYFTQIKKARVNIDYHIQFDKNYYSVPHNLCRLEVQVHATRDSVAIFYKGQQVARHIRHHYKGKYATNPSHMPEAHKKHHQWTPQRLMDWGASIGPSVRELVQVMLNRKHHQEQAYRSCLGLLNLSKRYDAIRLNKACRRAFDINSPNYRSVKSILQNGLDKIVEHSDKTDHAHLTLLNEHDNIRGSMYYH